MFKGKKRPKTMLETTVCTGINGKSLKVWGKTLTTLLHPQKCSKSPKPVYYTFTTLLLRQKAVFELI